MPKRDTACDLVRHILHSPLRWRHNGRDGVINHQPHDCLLNRLFRRRPKKTSKLRVTGLCEGNSPVTGEFPTQWASNAENVSIWWRHHAVAADDYFRSMLCPISETKRLIWTTKLRCKYDSIGGIPTNKYCFETEILKPLIRFAILSTSGATNDENVVQMTPYPKMLSLTSLGVDIPTTSLTPGDKNDRSRKVRTLFFIYLISTL